MSGSLTFAVPRGALMPGSLALLDAAGYDTVEVRANDRRLLFADAGIITMRPSDVPTYVEHGVADLGIVGKDVLLEQGERELYELVDLGFGRCEMVFATPDDVEPGPGFEQRLGTVRIATKYPHVTERYFNRTGRQVELIEVKGSVELAAIAGLAQGIVDLTATGATLRENGLTVRESITTVSARLIANPAAYRLKAGAIDALAAKLVEAIPAKAGAT